MTIAEFTDVLICGAGPVGLLTALGLAQQHIDTLIIEKRERHEQELFGRACTLYPRTLELLEQRGVLGDMTQAGFHGRSYAVYREGKRVTRKAWQSMFPMIDNSFHNYILNIRQKNSERIFAAKYKEDHSKDVYHGWELVELTNDQSLGDGYNVTATISNAAHGKRIVRCKYVVGADGGNSMVRRLSGISMEGNETTYRWIRVDGRMTTDMPEPNLVFAALETKAHGNVLWVRLDQDAYRIGFALTPSLQAKYPNGITQEQAISEAEDSIKPFHLKIDRLDWWTQYNVKQKVATALEKDFVLLAGDAAHTHSSAFAQGMNTGVHDATNLTWKLAGALKGWYKAPVLASYALERRAAAERLISIDRLAAATVSGDIPAGFQQAGMSNEDALRSVMETNMSFTTGLGISYDPSALVASQSAATTLVPGFRCPDALLRAPGPTVPMRLHDILNASSAKGRWTALVFAGHHFLTKSRVVALRDAVTAPGGAFAKRADRIGLATILMGTVGGAWEAFDGPAVGNLYFDTEGIAHSRYGVYPDSGAVVVLRPDGVLSFAVALDEADKIEEFLAPIFA